MNTKIFKSKMKIILGVFFAIALIGCKSVKLKEIETNSKDKIIYNKVGIHSEWKGDTFLTLSTNYIGTNIFHKINTGFTLNSISKSQINLNIIDSNKQLVIKFIKKHNQQEIDEYFNSMFSSAKIEIPAALSEKEKKHIENGSYFKGMSKDALILAIGYPPMSLNSNSQINSLTYMIKRFNKVKFELNDDNKILNIVN